MAVAVVTIGPALEEEALLQEDVVDLSRLFSERVSGSNEVEPFPLTFERIRKIEQATGVDVRIARAVAKHGVSDIRFNLEIHKSHLETKYNIEVGKGTDQQSSGRCWIFSGTNLMRCYTKQKGKDTEFSQNYISFWDKFERANHFLNVIASYGGKQWDDPGLQNALEHIFSEGGEWELFRNIVKKHGIVPATTMPETEFSGKSAGYIDIITRLLRRKAIKLHQLANEMQLPGLTAQEISFKKLKIQEYMDKAMVEVRDVLVSYLGEPPKEFRHQNSESKWSKITPQQYYEYLECNLDNFVHLCNLPYVEEGRRIQFSEIGNVEEGERLQALNLSMGEIKTALRLSIQAGDPVEVGTEMQRLDRDKGLLSIENDRMEEIFGLEDESEFDKGELLRYRATSVAHGMLLVGCDDVGVRKCVEEGPCPESLGPLWKVENSWKDQQFIYMTEPWFDRYAYSFILHKQHLSPRALAYLEGGEVQSLPSWDPFARI